MAQPPHTGGKRGIVPDFGQLELPAAHRHTTSGGAYQGAALRSNIDVVVGLKTKSCFTLFGMG